TRAQGVASPPRCPRRHRRQMVEHAQEGAGEIAAEDMEARGERRRCEGAAHQRKRRKEVRSHRERIYNACSQRPLVSAPMELHTVRPTWRSPVVLLGFAVVAVVRLATLPASLWEWDEVLFVKGVELFDPVHHRPHPPGYPLLIGLGKLLRLVTGDPFHALVALSVISCLVGYLALVSAFTRMAAG